MHCRLSQQISNCEKGRRYVSIQLCTSIQYYHAKAVFSEYGLPKKIMSDVGGNFISDKFKQFCKTMNIEQATSSSLMSQTGRGMYKIHKTYNEKIYQN